MTTIIKEWITDPNTDSVQTDSHQHITFVSSHGPNKTKTNPAAKSYEDWVEHKDVTECAMSVQKENNSKQDSSVRNI